MHRVSSSVLVEPLQLTCSCLSPPTLARLSRPEYEAALELEMWKLAEEEAFKVCVCVYVLTGPCLYCKLSGAVSTATDVSLQMSAYHIYCVDLFGRSHCGDVKRPTCLVWDESGRGGKNKDSSC